MTRFDTARQAVGRAFSAFAVPLQLTTLRVVGAGSLFALNLVMARTMERAEMGHAVAGMALAMSATILVTGGVEAGAARFMIRYLDKGEAAAARGFVRFTDRLAMVMGLLVGLGAPAALALYAAETGQRPDVVTMLALVGAALLGWIRVQSRQAFGLSHVVFANWPNQAARPILTIGAVAAWAYALGAPTAVQVMTLFVACLIAVAGIQAHGLSRRMAAVPSVPPDVTERRRWLGVGLQLGLPQLFVENRRPIALTLAALVLAPEETALLAVPLALMGFVNYGLIAVSQSIAPKLSRAIQREDEPEVTRLLTLASHMRLWPVIPAVLGVLLLGPPLLEVFGRDFRSAAILLPILLIEPVAIALLGPGAHVLSFSKRQDAMMPLAALTLAVLAGGVLLGGRAYGIEGAAMGYVAAGVVWSLSLAAFARFRLGRDVTVITPLADAMIRKRAPKPPVGAGE